MKRQRVELSSPHGYATGKNADGHRHLPNGAQGTVIGGWWSGNLRVSFDYPHEGTYELPAHWFTLLPRRSRPGTAEAIRRGVGTTPRNVGPELNGVVAFPRDFVPLLRPDGPYCGSGL